MLLLSILKWCYCATYLCNTWAILEALFFDIKTHFLPINILKIQRNLYRNQSGTYQSRFKIAFLCVV